MSDYTVKDVMDKLFEMQKENGERHTELTSSVAVLDTRVTAVETKQASAERWTKIKYLVASVIGAEPVVRTINWLGHVRHK